MIHAALTAKMKLLKIKNDDHRGVILWNRGWVPGVKLTPDIQASKILLEWQVHVSMKFRTIHTVLWAKMNVSLK
jgi:hypothetical protein